MNSEEMRIYKEIYRPTIYAISREELKFYNVLCEIAKELDMTVLCQVPLYQIVNMKTEIKKGINDEYFDKIKSKSIDFVLVRKYDCRIRLCIELNDKTHETPTRKIRDEFLDSLFKSLNINFLQYKTYKTYNKEILKKRIQANMKFIKY